MYGWGTTTVGLVVTVANELKSITVMAACTGNADKAHTEDSTKCCSVLDKRIVISLSELFLEYGPDSYSVARNAAAARWLATVVPVREFYFVFNALIGTLALYRSSGRYSV